MERETSREMEMEMDGHTWIQIDQLMRVRVKNLWKERDKKGSYTFGTIFGNNKGKVSKKIFYFFISS